MIPERDPLPDGPSLLLPPVPALVAGPSHVGWLSPEGESEVLTPAEARARLDSGVAPFVCHLPATARRLGLPAFPALDLLELFAFVHPARFVVPAPRGLAEALGLPCSRDLEAQALMLMDAAALLLRRLAALRPSPELLGMATVMASGGWPWGQTVLHAVARSGLDVPSKGVALEAMKVWRRLPEHPEFAPEPPPGQQAVEAQAAGDRLAALLGASAEARPQQQAYTQALLPAFAPREAPDTPHVVLAEAGTGIGKTLGYIAPASLWAEINRGPVWLSTYTRQLQRQLDAELDRLYPDPAQKAERVVLRKGRENYLCLLNYEEAVLRLAANPKDAVALGLMARWLGATRDGDLWGGDWPGWLSDLVGRPLTQGLADRRGECIYSACAHYGKCFIERAVRRARRAAIVVANHALVMMQAALGGLDDTAVPTRYVFDEGHHLFDAADGAFALSLSGLEAAELRRWLLGPEEGARTRGRGLRRRLEELVAGQEAAEDALGAILHGARILPGPGWHQRLGADQPQGPAETFLALVRRQVQARAQGASGQGAFDLEAECQPLIPGLAEAAAELDEALGGLLHPVVSLGRALAAILDAEAAELETSERQRLEAMIRSLRQRAEMPLKGWKAMLQALDSEAPPQFVDWMAIRRIDGREVDAGLHRHWIDPTLPFAETVAARAHGLVVTSATLTDGTGDEAADWRAAEARTGALHLPEPAHRARLRSPFDYPRQTRVLVVTDLGRDDINQIASAYRELFLAGGGGALGLFTAISRLRQVHARIAPALEAEGLDLLAQHVDAMDPATLVEIFRAEEDACLLGTDAMRDGMDVPGRALRLLVFDRVPWPRPDILHRARRQAALSAAYDDMITRLRLKQAFGRLVRRADDVGVFVLLDSRLPSRLAGAFPEGVAIERVGLAEAVRITRDFLRRDHSQD